MPKKTIDALEIEAFTKLLDSCGLPKDTPKTMVVDLLQAMEEQGIDRNNEQAVEKILLNSPLWSWVKGQQVELNEELPFEEFTRRIAALFGV